MTAPTADAPVVVVGVGVASAARADELATLVADVLAAAGLAPRHVRALATLDRRVEQVERLRPDPAWPVLGFAADHLDAVVVPSPSASVAEHTGTPSVAEAAALLGAAHLAGSPATLLALKHTSAHATAAVAVAPRPRTP